MFHESFLLKKCKDKESLLQVVSKHGINVNKDNWGEKVPYFPSARKYPIVKYCKQWNEYFGESSRILHIVRHPYDVALSNVKKFKNINSVDKPIQIYKNIIPNAIEKIDKMDSVYTFKYEDLLLHPEEMMINIYKHCGIKSEIDFKKRMKKIKNKRYQGMDSSRAFAYKKQHYKWKYDLKEVLKILNNINGVNYDL